MCRFIWDYVADEIDPCETAILAYRSMLEKHHPGKHSYCFTEYFIYATHKTHLKANGMA